MNNSITLWLEKTAKRFPDRPAFCDENHIYTYGQVRSLALAIAQGIREQYGLRKSPIAIYMEKSAEMLITYLGIAYSGNFYSPIAADMPVARIEKIIGTLRPQLIIAKEDMKDAVDWKALGYGKEVADYESMTAVKTDEEKATAYAQTIIDTDLLYVLFTSGSTGVPKGVAITHRGVIDYIDWVVDEFGITEKDSFANQAPFYFDNSILDIYSCVKTGATLYIVPDGLFSQPVKLLEYLVEKKITTIFWVPSALIMVSKLKAFRNVDVSATLKRVLFCGEVMPNKQLNIWRSYLPDLLYANLYGPTEITDACTFYTIDREFTDEEPLPIGRPMPNTEIIVLNDKDEPVTGTENGELCVRGSSLAVGYYNNPEKTKENFVQNPLNTAYEEKIYRTGDVVYYNEYGELVYVCRKDFQIKHMGHRIELGEIETAVSSLDVIDNCCCLYDDKKQKIVLFAESSKEDLDKHYIADAIKELVPDYMIPNKVIRLENFPYNLNGKIDRVVLKNQYL